MAAYESWRFEIAWQSAPDDPAPIWTDETSRVDGAVRIVRGRRDERDEVDASHMSLDLANHDQRYTPGNVESPLYPYVLPARRCRLIDTVAGVEYPLFDGYLEPPEIEDWQKSNSAAPRDQVIAINAVDRMGRLDRARRYISTLGEHIRYRSGMALRAYWTLGQSGAPVDVTIGDAWTLREQVRVHADQWIPTDPAVPSISYGEPGGPAGDDLAMVAFQPSRDVANNVYVQSIRLAGTRGTGVDLAAGTVMTIVAWVRIDAPLANSIPRLVQIEDGTSAYASIELDSSGRLVVYGEKSASWSGTVTGPTAPTDMAVPVAVRFGFDPAVIELWVGDDVYTGTMTVTTPNAASLDTIKIGHGFDGQVNHVQVYVGAEDDWDHGDFLAQGAAGRDGLARQTADQRIATLAQYAGLSTTDLELDRASAVLPVAALAGQTPGALWRQAAAADNGLLIARGDGRVAFHGRQRRYSPPLAATVQLGWLSKQMSLRTDPPVNVMQVSSTSGAGGSATNTSSVSEFGEYADGASLDTAVPADPGNLAAFTVREFGQPRTRGPRLVFELRHQTDAVRALILGREVSERCALAGLPSNAPQGLDQFHIEGVAHTISTRGHRVEWNTGPILGEVPGVPAHYPLVGAAFVGNTTRIPF